MNSHLAFALGQDGTGLLGSQFYIELRGNSQLRLDYPKI
jgi:hypothetical protein